MNIPHVNGNTPLHSGIQFKHSKVARLLIKKGADIGIINIIGESPLDIAIETKQKEIAELLRKHGGKTAEELKAKQN